MQAQPSGMDSYAMKQKDQLIHMLKREKEDMEDVIAQLRNKEQELLDQHRRQLEDLRDELE